MTATPAEAVVDASVVVRALHGESERAVELLLAIGSGETAGHAPDLILPEVTSALSRYVAAGRYQLGDAVALLDTLGDAPIEIHASATLAPAALEAAHSKGITTYDALYAVLADALDVPLVTADRKLARRIRNAIVV